MGADQVHRQTRRDVEEANRYSKLRLTKPSPRVGLRFRPLTRARGLNLDIDGWLRRIGLEQYAQTFRDNAIDADVLRDLTDDHLRELGLPLGVRLKLLRAVAGTSEQPPASPEITPNAPRTDAERRQLTVMFCDLMASASAP